MIMAHVMIVEGLSSFGNAEPRVQFAHPESVRYRDVHSCLYALASEIERLSKDDDPWTVVVDTGSGNVHLELVYDANSPSDRKNAVERGMAVLHLVLEQISAGQVGSS
jgi:hypothetical protein